MSRIGKKPVPVPGGVKVNVAGREITVEGKLGKLDVHASARGERQGRRRRQDRALHAAIQKIAKSALTTA